VTTYQYDPVGLLDTMTLPNGVISGYTYDALNRLTQIEQHTGVSMLAAYTYDLDAIGNRQSVTELDV